MTIHDVAVRYVAGGLCVIPIVCNGTKRPAIASWSEFQERLPTPEELRQWFEANHHSALAIIAGAVSGRLEVIDFDRPGFYERWHELVDTRAPGLLKRLPHVRTPSGGLHVYLRSGVAVEGNLKLAWVLDEGKRVIAIETRGEGGYVIAPGSSKEAHPDKKEYSHVKGTPGAGAVPTLSEVERRILLDCARALNEVPGSTRESSTSTGAPSQGDRPGDEFNRAATWDEVLEPHGWKKHHQSLQGSFWCRPGKDPNEGWSATADVCKNDRGQGLLYVFSSNAAPLEPEKSYSKFSAFALLNHAGDFSAAARALGAAGYGDQEKPSTPPVEDQRIDDTLELALIAGLASWIYRQEPKHMIRLAAAGRSAGGALAGLAVSIGRFLSEDSALSVDDVRLRFKVERRDAEHTTLESLLEKCGPAIQDSTAESAIAAVDAAIARARATQLIQALSQLAHQLEQEDIGSMADVFARVEILREGDHEGAHRWRALSVQDLARMPEPEWIVADWLPAAGLAALYGQPGCGKSFVGIDLAMCIASGISWHGARCRPGRVLLCAGEGLGGIYRRILAWTAGRPPELIERVRNGMLLVLPTVPQLLDPEQVAGAIRAWKRLRPALIIVDTLARALSGGDENSAEDMGRAVEALDLIRRETGATALAIHHAGKDETRGARGSSALLGACDSMLALTKDGDRLMLTVEKQKDAEPPRPILLALDTVSLGPGQDGREASSCRVRRLTGAEAAMDLAGAERAVLALLRRPEHVEGLTPTDIRGFLEDMPKTTFFRAVSALLEAGLLSKKRSLYRAAPEGDR